MQQGLYDSNTSGLESSTTDSNNPDNLHNKIDNIDASINIEKSSGSVRTIESRDTVNSLEDKSYNIIDNGKDYKNIQEKNDENNNDSTIDEKNLDKKEDKNKSDEIKENEKGKNETLKSIVDNNEKTSPEPSNPKPRSGENWSLKGTWTGTGKPGMP